MIASLQADRCIVIPDVHQDTAWVDRILTRETDADRYVFLGDYFDPHGTGRRTAGVAETGRYFDRLRTTLRERAIFLLGNHDVQYLEARPFCLRHQVPRHLHYRCGSAFRAAAAAKVAKTLPAAFWQETQLFTCVNGWLLSHAGVHRLFWPPRPTLDSSLAALAQACRTALDRMPHQSDALLHAGFVRGGDQAVGGITWLDWDHEFEDDLPCPQIVGHTARTEGPRRRGRSWCIDGAQTGYARLDRERVELRNA